MRPPSSVIETSDISINSSGAAFVALPAHHPIGGQLEEAQWFNLPYSAALV